MESREDMQNEVSVLAFGRGRYEIYTGLGYERNLFKIRKHSFISLQGEYNRGLFQHFDKKYDYFLIAPKYNVQNGRVITSLYPMFGSAPHLKRRALSLNLSNKYDFPKLKLTFAVNLAVETISYPPTVNSKGNFNPTSTSNSTIKRTYKGRC